MKRAVIGGIIIILIAAGGYFYFRPAPPLEVKVAKVSRGDISSVVSASGTVRSEAAARLSFKIAGRIAWFGLDEGDQVFAGQVAASLDKAELEAQLAQAKAALAQAEYDVAEAARNFKRVKELYDQKISSQQDFDRARSGEQLAAARRAQAEAAYDLVKTQRASADLRVPFDGVVTAKLSQVGEVVAPGMPVLEVVNPRRLTIDAQIDQVDIGVVEVGQPVTIFTDAFPERKFLGKVVKLVREATLKRVGGRIKLDEEDLVFKAKIRPEGVTELAPTVKMSGLAPSGIEGLAPSGIEGLAPGMSVDVDITTQSRKGVLLVPRAALSSSDSHSSVYLIRGNRVEVREVVVGIKDPERVEILGGLGEGEPVAVSSLEKLKPGLKVKIIE